MLRTINVDLPGTLPEIFTRARMPHATAASPAMYESQGQHKG